MKKYLYRISISVLIYFFFRINEERHWQDVFAWNEASTFYLIYTIAVILLIWEVLSRSINHWKQQTTLSNSRGLYKISGKATILVLPFVFFFSYLFVYYIKPQCDCPVPNPRNMESQFWMLSAQGFVIALLIQAYEIIRLYIRMTIQNVREKELIQKELIAARFEGLKNQVNPHFLFNSFSVLTSLVESKPEVAVEFIAKLSDMYRYILENDEKDVVPIEQELAFLDDYLFLMQMRHQQSIIIDKNIRLDGLNIELPPMSLQILVENAVKHNSFSPDEPLHILIQNEGDQFIVVENQKRPKPELERSTGIGLKNLSKRLLLSVKKGLEIVDSPQLFRVKVQLLLK
jgi:sensor histidine kinase YesM